MRLNCIGNLLGVHQIFSPFCFDVKLFAKLVEDIYFREYCSSSSSSSSSALELFEPRCVSLLYFLLRVRLSLSLNGGILKRKRQGQEGGGVFIGCC
jgi:hypothetical protein